jgi:hypothetical protein
MPCFTEVQQFILKLFPSLFCIEAPKKNKPLPRLLVKDSTGWFSI